MVKSRRMRWAGNVACVGENLNPYRVLVRKLKGNLPVGISRCRWDDNIKKDLREIG
jgi:hypothetical protein